MQPYMSSPGGSPASFTHWSNDMYSPEFQHDNRFTQLTDAEHVYGPKSLESNQFYQIQDFPIRQNTYSQSTLDNIRNKIEHFSLDTADVKIFIILIILYILHILFGDNIRNMTDMQLKLILILLVVVYFII